MPIFSVKDGKLELISEVQLNLEMDIQRMVEKNMNTVFGLNFISSGQVTTQKL